MSTNMNVLHKTDCKGYPYNMGLYTLERVYTEQHTLLETSFALCPFNHFSLQISPSLTLWNKWSFKIRTNYAYPWRVFSSSVSFQRKAARVQRWLHNAKPNTVWRGSWYICIKHIFLISIKKLTKTYLIRPNYTYSKRSSLFFTSPFTKAEK